VFINGRAFTIVGITPKGFVGTMQILSPEVWLPMSVYDQVANDFGSDNRTTIDDRKGTQLRIMGRLRPGLTADAAKPELTGLAANLEKAYPVEQKDQTFMAERVSRNTRAAPHDARKSQFVSRLVAAVGALFASFSLKVLCWRCSEAWADSFSDCGRPICLSARCAS